MRPSLPAAVLAALALVASLAVGAAPASAAGDRAAARAFGAAADRFHAAAMQVAPEVQRRFEAILAPRCARAFGAAPRRVRPIAEQFAAAMALDATLTPLRPAVEAFVGELDGVTTRDRVLRRGRAAWRASVGELDVVRPVPADACARLDAWRRAGYPKDELPAIPRLSAERLEQLDRDSRGAQRRLRRAAGHLRRLGVSRRTARRFAGASLTRVLEDALSLPGTPA
jgi:hypothetical protein